MNGLAENGTRVLRLDPGRADITALDRLARSGARALNEQFDTEAHLNEVIPKPWGYEYRAYVDEFFDFWALHIDSPHSTSMHVHPRKLTYLVCLGGRGVTSGLRSEHPVSAGTIVRISQGAFHSTRNVSDDPLELIEIEVPRNKFDLLRLRDDYNRAGTAYESKSLSHPEHPMRVVPQRPHTRMRAGTPDGRFLFELRTGMDVFYRRREQDIFYVPLSLAGVVQADVRVLGRDHGRTADTDQMYLCILRAA